VLFAVGEAPAGDSRGEVGEAIAQRRGSSATACRGFQQAERLHDRPAMRLFAVDHLIGECMGERDPIWPCGLFAAQGEQTT
jgi:hypothetical protein